MAAKPGFTSKTTWEVCKADFLALTTDGFSGAGDRLRKLSSVSSRAPADPTSWKTRGQRDKTRRLRNK